MCREFGGVGRGQLRLCLRGTGFILGWHVKQQEDRGAIYRRVLTPRSSAASSWDSLSLSQATVEADVYSEGILCL